ncbi:biotin--[acetyl-CoA-carboxylase] ligase [Anaplasma capra]|uniref:biotin--[acetyl-CoA-carboxylase] ligase n=1 Tax=Anaplasma capra TaxID=1562740 RepID=UPI0021D60DD0|nr:biotin--[acetyl-CoA-carboxylase] ligase [Anaplasma capra]MCU7611409.1 biotin--[acetyl-CoA-carboxylase] ligase [Anaplasma capra]MCU7612152.1 biotin--[acetyl-CoA-carboxylase] ligase [Anaplasma capra]
MKFVIRHASTSHSTNSDAIELAHSGALDGTVVVADEQISGTGRHGREWHSPKGNLYFSAIIRRNLQVAELSFVSSLAVGITIEQIFETHTCSEKKALIRYKWPNDVIVDNKKISGVLIKTKMVGGTVDWAVCGIGVNMYAPPTYATSLKAHIPEFKLSNLELLDMVLQNLDKLLNILTDMGFSHLRSLWLNRGPKLGDKICIMTNSKGTVEGRFVDIDMLGAIVLDSGSKILTINYGEIL